MQNGTVNLEHSLMASYKTKTYSSPIIQQVCSLVFTQRSWKSCLHKNLNMDVYSKFIHIAKTQKESRNQDVP